MIKQTIFIGIITSFTTVTSGQNIELVNVNVSKSDSKTIYVGIQNKFKITNFSSLRKIEPVSPVISIHEDTLLLRPHSEGSFALSFYTEGGKQEVVFNSRVVSDGFIALGDLTGKVVEKSEVMKQGRIRIYSADPGEIFFDNYAVYSFEARLNNQTFIVKGDRFSKELLAAIRLARPGDQLVFASVKAGNAKVSNTLSFDTVTYELK